MVMTCQRDKFTTVRSDQERWLLARGDAVVLNRRVGSAADPGRHISILAVMEKIVGLSNGFHVASYARPAANGTRYANYAKVCRDRPGNYRDVDCAFKLFGGENHPAASAALANVVAREQIEDLPSLQCSTFGLDLPFVSAGG